MKQSKKNDLLKSLPDATKREILKFIYVGKKVQAGLKNRKSKQPKPK